MSHSLGFHADGCESLFTQYTIQFSGNRFPHSWILPFANGMVILPCCKKKTYFCIQPVGGVTFGTGIFAEIFNPGAFTYTTWTGTLVWAHLWFGLWIWLPKSCLRKPQLILEGWKNIWTTCGKGVGKVIAHRRNNEGARCPKVYDNNN